jgi:hypothetical protein
MRGGGSGRGQRVGWPTTSDLPAAPSEHAGGGAGQPCCLPHPRSGEGEQGVGERARLGPTLGEGSSYRPTTRKVGFKLSKVGCELKNVGCELKKVGFKLKKVGRELKKIGCERKKVGCERKKVGCELRKVGCELRKAGCERQACNQ